MSELLRWIGLPIRVIVALLGTLALSLFGVFISGPEGDIKDLWYWAWKRDI